MILLEIIDHCFSCTVEKRLFLFYFLVQFGQGFSWSATTLLLNNELKLEPSQVVDYYAFCYLPWSLKLIFAYISDCLPIFAYRRKAYVFIYALATGFFMILYSLFGKSYQSVLWFGFFVNMFECATQVLIDALVVERVRKEKEELGKGQSLSLMFKSAGTVVSTLCALLFTNNVIRIPYRAFYAISSIAYFIVACMSYKLEDESTSIHSFKKQMILAFKVIFKGVNDLNIITWKPLWPLIIFVFIKTLMPTSSTMMYSYLLRINVEDWQVVLMNSLTSFVAMIGNFIYSLFFTNKSLTRMIIWTTIASAICSLLELIIFSLGGNDVTKTPESYLYYVALIIECLTSTAGQMAIIPIMIMVSRACPLGLEASIWSLFFTFNDLASSASGKITGWISDGLSITSIDYSNMPIFVTICSICSIIPLFYIFFIKQSLHMLSVIPDADKDEKKHLVIYQ